MISIKLTIDDAELLVSVLENEAAALEQLAGRVPDEAINHSACVYGALAKKIGDQIP